MWNILCVFGCADGMGLFGFVADTGKVCVRSTVGVSKSEIPAEKLISSIYRTPVPRTVQGPTDRLLSGAEHTQQAKKACNRDTHTIAQPTVSAEVSFCCVDRKRLACIEWNQSHRPRDRVPCADPDFS